jgi:hypothetical protein
MIAELAAERLAITVPVDSPCSDHQPAHPNGDHTATPGA